MLKGRKPITLDISLEDYNTDPIKFTKAFLGKCLTIHRQNVNDIKHLEDVYRGEQEVLRKTRKTSSEINNVVVENHVNNIVNFKVGFTVGNPIEYSHTSSIETQDMDYFAKYLNDCKKSSLDVEKYGDIYKFGIAYRMITYREEDVDTNWQSPFRLINLSPLTTFVVKESGILHRTLFSCVINKRLNVDTMRTKTYYTIYLKNAYFELTNDYQVEKSLEIQDYADENPIIEYEANAARMGLIEMIESLQNAINSQDSLELDDVEEFVNYYIVFKNQNFEDEDFINKYKEFKKERVLLLKTQNPNQPADVSMLKTSMEHTDLNTLYKRFIDAMYNILAVPLSSGNVTSGGDTGAARLLGNGWETAQNRAELDTTWLDKYEYEEIKRMITISREISNSKMKDLYPSDIAITYKINMSDNLYTKTESLQMLYAMNFPKEIALNTCKITSDTHGVAEKWEANDKKAKEEANALELAKTQVKQDNSTENQSKEEE